MNVNTQSTNTMLTGIPNVNAYNVGTFLSEKGVLVSLHIGRKRHKVSMPKSVLGIDKDDPFYQDYGETGCFSLLKKKDEAELMRIEGAIRNKARSLSIGLDGKYMLVDVYEKEFKPFYQATKAEYFAKRDEICGNWDKIVDEFKSALHAFLIGLPTYSPEIEKSLMANIPNVHAFASSFYMDVRLETFPVASNLPLMDPAVAAELKESIQKQAIDAVYNIMGNLMNEANDTLAKRILAHTSGKAFNGHAINTLTSLKDKLAKNNLFNEDIVKQICADLTVVVNLIDERKSTLNVSRQASLDEEIVEKMEGIMICIYGYCKEHELELQENGAISIADMEILYQASKADDSDE